MLCMSEMSKDVKDVEDRSNTPKGCNAMYVEDVKDRSNTPKGCNAMYVRDVTFLCVLYLSSTSSTLL